jgi:virulence-associated protein VapD
MNPFKKLVDIVLGPEAAAASMVFDFFGGISQKNSADKAAEKAQEIANFNASIIERDIEILQKQADIITANGILREQLDRYEFRKVQGSVVTGTSYAGFEIAEGTPMENLVENAQFFELDMLINQRNDMIALEQIADAQEDARLQAELARMGGSAEASMLRSRGTQALLGSFGNVAKTAYQRGAFDRSPMPTSYSTSVGSRQTRIG